MTNSRPSVPAPEAPQPSMSPAARKATVIAALVAVVGAVPAASLLEEIPADESGRVVVATVTREGEVDMRHVRGERHFKAYRDIAGIWTICDGDTYGVRPGMVETPEGCDARTARQITEHAIRIRACLPQLWAPGRDKQREAAIRFGYNVGTGALCVGNRSGTSVHDHFRAGRWRAGCDRMLVWNKSKIHGPSRPAVPVRGLTLRRERERATCVEGLPA